MCAAAAAGATPAGTGNATTSGSGSAAKASGKNGAAPRAGATLALATALLGVLAGASAFVL
jgi:hypothetical protein